MEIAVESDRLLPKASGFSKRAIRALRLTLGVLGLWECDAIEKASEYHSLIKSGWNEDNNNGTMIEEVAESEQSFQSNLECDSCFVDITSLRQTHPTVNSGSGYGATPMAKPQKGMKTCKWLLCHLFWFAYLLLMLAILFYDLEQYLYTQWGHQDELLHLVSYCTFLFQVLVVPMFCFIARIRSAVFYRHAHFTQCLPTINCTLVLRRALFLQSPACAALSCLNFALFLSWPLANGLIRVSYDYWIRFVSAQERNESGNATLSYVDMVHEEISHWAAVIGYLQYGTFCYLIYILRSSLQWELRAVEHIISNRSSTKNVDSCRNRISEVYAHFRVLRDFVGLWMAFTMVVATWGLTAHVTWNYAIFSRCTLSREGRKHIMFLNGLIWSQKVMFFVLPYIAVGGLNLQYIWQEFRYNLIRLRRLAQDSNFWKPVIEFSKQINFSGLTLKPTILFSAIGLFLGLKIRSTNQKVEFWNGPYQFEHSSWGFCVNATS